MTWFLKRGIWALGDRGWVTPIRHHLDTNIVQPRARGARCPPLLRRNLADLLAMPAMLAWRALCLALQASHLLFRLGSSDQLGQVPVSAAGFVCS